MTETALGSGTAMQVAGRIIDRVPPGRLVPVSVAAAVAGFGLFTVQLSADASYWGLCATMLLMGAGGGATMMPAMTAATRGLSHDEAPAASTTVNLITTTSGAAGLAGASVVLSALMNGLVPDGADSEGGALQAVHGMSPQDHAAIAGPLAGAFRHTYLFALALLALALIPALLLPRHDTK
ncbi:hypothetical protein ACH35V_16980 [Actinomadura sp. 1N219]|uniref:hypothetical protein n=1 Tax=Actinomadura sp. 1N219 TaxID=3375152 RepID=UPI00378C27BE